MGFKPRDIGARMGALASRFASAHDLDLTLGALGRFESAVLAERDQRSDEAITRWGAYFGETIRRACDGAVEWVDYETAARASPAVAALEPGADIAAILSSGSTFVFPLAKVVKFLDNGSEDSPAAFGPVAITMLTPAPKPTTAPKTLDRADFPAREVAAFDRFFAEPGPASLDALDRITTHLHRSKIAHLLREKAFEPAVFEGLFAEEPSGRGLARRNRGGIAARWLWTAVAANAVDTDAVAARMSAHLESGSDATRRNAAYVLGRIALSRGENDRFTERFAASGKPVRAGLLGALRSVVYDAVMSRGEYPSLDPHADVLRRALAGTVGDRNVALEIIQQIGARLDRSLAPLLGALHAILESGKPAQVERALLAITGHVWSIKHRGVPFTPELARCIDAIARHSRPVPGKTKVTKVQIAARYTLSALSAIDRWAEPRTAG